MREFAKVVSIIMFSITGLLIGGRIILDATYQYYAKAVNKPWYLITPQPIWWIVIFLIFLPTLVLFIAHYKVPRSEPFTEAEEEH